MPFLFLLIALVFGLSASFAADAVDQHVEDKFDSPATDTLSQRKEYRSIPLPGQTAYNGVGLTFGMGFGMYIPPHDCDCMGSWQVQMEYFYLDWLSGGGNVRFYGGDLDNDVMVMYQRYSGYIRLHTTIGSVDMYVGSVLGFENTSFAEFRKQVSDKSTKKNHWWKTSSLAELDSAETEALCEQSFSLSGFSGGISLGAGYNFSRLFGGTFGAQLDYNFRKDFLLSLVPGIAFNLREVWPWVSQTLRSSWISFEVGGQKYMNRRKDGWSKTVFLGIQFGA